MRRRPSYSNHKSPYPPAFTLVELLVVIGIISVLAAILLPTLAGAKRRAHAVQCISNLRQLGQATFLYASDYGDQLPFAWIREPNPKHNNFLALLQPVLLEHGFDGFGDFELDNFSCPTRSREPLVGPNPMRISYGMNAFNAVEYAKPKTYRLTRVESRQPATVLLNADIAFEYNHPPIRTLEAKQVGYKHSKKANIVFYDGHVSAHSLLETNQIVLDF